MDLMKRRLRYSETKFFSFYHLHYYFSKEAEIGGVRKMILDFKRYEEAAVRHFIMEALETMQLLDMEDYVLIVRALSSQELVIGDMGRGSVDRLGQSLAAVFGWDYDPEVIYKKRHALPVKTMRILQRQAVLDGIYAFNPEPFENLTRVLIIDDIVTTGTTVRAIAAPILKAFPKAEIMVFALAWTPTARQQERILQTTSESFVLHEPESEYNTPGKWLDTDYEFSETHVTI
ncbi:ComF family protein [Mucilaginibacter sp. Mucisp84]|uniref:ComF family protein n=1 Tax=Mucilaginibacter sp. Mucisp84 TaxID=3243058 RepID=UPI0039A51AF2